MMANYEGLPDEPWCSSAREKRDVLEPPVAIARLVLRELLHLRDDFARLLAHGLVALCRPRHGTRATRSCRTRSRGATFRLAAASPFFCEHGP